MLKVTFFGGHKPKGREAIMNRRKFLAALSSIAFADKIIAGSLSLDDIQSMRDGTGIDAERIEKETASYYWSNIIKQGYFAQGNNKNLLIRDKKIQQLIQEIAIPIYKTSTRKDLDWLTVLVADTPRSIVGCTCGGGAIFMGTFLTKFCRTEEEFVGVIAHEVGHNEYRHTQKHLLMNGVYKSFSMMDSMSFRNTAKEHEQFMKDLTYLAYHGYKRLNENEADAYIVKAFLKAGYDVKRSSACSEMLVRLGGMESGLDEKTCLYRTHPENIARLKRVKAIQSTYANRVKPRTSGLFNELQDRVMHYEKQQRT